MPEPRTMTTLSAVATPNDGEETPSKAPRFPVPSDRIVSVEHPCIIRNMDNGIKSLGGEPQMKTLLERSVGDSEINKQMFEPEISVRLRPNDPFAKWISADGVKTRNVLVKVTVPKRTGRRRKKGTNDEFVEDPNPKPSAQDPTARHLLQRMREAQGDYTVEPIGLINETHRFRNLPDFQTRMSEIPVYQTLRQHYEKPSYDTLKHLTPDLMPGSGREARLFPPPPSFVQHQIPHVYEYQQPTHIKVGRKPGTGEISVVNTQRRHLKKLPPVNPNIETVPTGPWQEVPKIVANRELLEDAVQELNRMLEERPIVTRRVAHNLIPGFDGAVFNEAIQHVAYVFESGPFRDVLIKYGVDPRKDPKYRFYQSFMFQVDRHAGKGKDTSNWGRPGFLRMPDDPGDHIFDGERTRSNGKVWQACDITDPVVYRILHTENIRTEFDNSSWGWFHNGTMAKVRCIMRDKIYKLLHDIPLPDEEYDLIEKFPDEVTKENQHETVIPTIKHGTSRNLAKMVSDFKVIATSDRYQQRGSKKKANALDATMAGAEEVVDEEDDDGDALGDLERLGDIEDDDEGNGIQDELASDGMYDEEDEDMNGENDLGDDQGKGNDVGTLNAAKVNDTTATSVESMATPVSRDENA